MKRRMIVLMLTGVLVFSLSACESAMKNADQTNELSVVTEMPENIEDSTGDEELSVELSVVEEELQAQTEEAEKTEMEGDGFSESESEPEYEDKSHVLDPETTGDYTDLDQELEEVEAQAKVLEDSFRNDSLSQVEMNMTSAEIYKLWDDELNRVWGYITQTFPEDMMEQIRAEQRAWIAERDAAIAEEGAEYEGGSIRPLIENDKGAELTRERTYELVNILKTR